MIFVKRLDKPSVLLKNEETWRLAIQNAQNKEEKKKAISRYKQKSIKNKLTQMFYGKCAFCESYIENVDYGDIEHFKPKSKFPLEAVKWENLLLSCKRCNSPEQKGNKWPTKNEGGFLINPCEEEPNDFFEFVFDETTNTSIVKPIGIRGETSERIYGLNKITLVRDRNSAIKKLLVLAKYYHKDKEAKEYLDEATESKSEYAAFARMVKSKYT